MMEAELDIVDRDLHDSDVSIMREVLLKAVTKE